MSGSELRGAGRAALLALLVAGAPTALGAQATGAADPLEALGALIVGTWEADGSRHEHEWGVGRLLIRSRSYARSEEGWALVAEGSWWWDEGAGTLRGLHFAEGMPMDRMEYRTRLSGDRVLHDFRTFGATEGRFRETWTFQDDSYRWTVERAGDDGYERLMGGVYRRAGEGGG